MRSGGKEIKERMKNTNEGQIDQMNMKEKEPKER